MSPFRRIIAAGLLALAAAAFGVPAGSGPAHAAPLSEEARADVARVEEYLNRIGTLRSDFLQASEDGGLARGTFYLSRPGRMRIDYDPPIEDFVVADGAFIYYWDAELEQVNNAPLGSTMADLILRRDLRLGGEVVVTDVVRRDGVLEVTLAEAKEPGKGRLTLVFEDEPLRLRKWRVLDAQGLTTEVALLNPEFDVPLRRSLFYFHNPNFGKLRND